MRYVPLEDEHEERPKSPPSRSECSSFMNNPTFWGITLCSLLEGSRRFGEHIVSSARVEEHTDVEERILFFYPEEGDDSFLRSAG
jgi:hypothetical protein